jgi:hypothetical protein
MCRGGRGQQAEREQELNDEEGEETFHGLIIGARWSGL